MIVSCLDMEGVLVPEIWIQVAERTRVKELRLTTRDIPDYDALMKRRIKILRSEGIRLFEIQEVIAEMEPLEGAVEFLERLRVKSQVVILSDTYYEFAMPLMKKLGFPTLFCNSLAVDRKGFIVSYHLRQENGKEKAVRGLKALGFKVKAVGDSYNDITMLQAADEGILFNPPAKIVKEFPKLRVAGSYKEILKILIG